MLLTCVVIYFTSALLLSKNIVVSFNAEAKKEIQYQVFYTEAKGQGMNEKQSVRKNIKSGSQKVEILLPIEKIVKIRLDIGSHPEEVIISDLQVKGSKNVKFNYNEFNKNQIDKYETKGNKLYIASNQGDPYIWYKQELNLPAGMQIDWCRLIIISVLAFLLMYKFVQYLSKFKIEKHHSRIDIVMLAVFFALLFLPMSHISDAEKSEQENRMLAKKPQLTIDVGGYNNYGVQFDTWYNDHFFGRDWMMGLYNNYISSSISRFTQNERAIQTSDGMIFNKGILDKLSKPISEQIKKKISDNIAMLQKFAADNDIDLYIMVPPSKEDIYKSKLKKIYSNIDENYSIVYDLQEYIKEKNNLNIIYPRKVYMKKYKDLTHSPTDHHWTEFGAFLGYNELIDEIRKKYPDIRKLKEDDFNIFYKDKPRLGGFSGLFDRPYYNGSDCDALGLKSNCPSFLHKYYDHKKLKELKVEYGPIDMSRITHYDEGIEANVTLIGNSYGGFLMEFLPYNFMNVQMIRVNNAEKGLKNEYDMKRFEKLILDFKTNILILYIASSYIGDANGLLGLY